MTISRILLLFPDFLLSHHTIYSPPSVNIWLSDWGQRFIASGTPNDFHLDIIQITLIRPT